MVNLSKISENLKELMAEHEISQKELAEKRIRGAQNFRIYSAARMRRAITHLSHLPNTSTVPRIFCSGSMITRMKMSPTRPSGPFAGRYGSYWSRVAPPYMHFRRAQNFHGA